MGLLADQDAIRTPSGCLVGVEHDDSPKSPCWLSQVLGGSGASASVTGTTVETTLASTTIPANMLGSGMLRVLLAMGATNNANVKTFRVRVGGVIVAVATPTSTAALRATAVVFGRPAAGQLVFHLSPPGVQDMSGSGALWSTAAVDMAVPQPLLITAQLAVGTDTAELVGWAAEILPAGWS